ncbi:MAG TPA: NADH-ubiquinone oxidoreductase-F iron-sulfur binding region domain-containing protein [Solirubrobacteraceae bacterium]|nr:NADH-ubiquinone oxidoreductase-F iron-sulfur binding region domain-containing protein [Solirubrobacteraceae bacterium]
MRLLAYAGRGGALSLAAHRECAGDRTARRGAELIDAVARAGLRGRGGAAFPTAVKMRAVAARRGRHALVINGAEGEPMSTKDRALLELAPHLVLDGALLVAEAIGARDIVLAVKRSAWASGEAVVRALAERRDARGVRLELVPDAYLSGEESALLQALNGGPAKPTLVPPRPYERGLARRPTLVANVETLAHVALIARHGADWFREVGTQEHPGSALVTVSGAVAQPGVYEVALGAPIADVIAGAGWGGEWRAALIGGYYGSWLSARDAGSARLDNASLRARGGSVGAGVVVALPVEACPAAEVARVVRWMADENAGQCGPCVHGLEAIAATVAALAAGTAARDTSRRLERWSGQVDGRGACHHPNGVVRFVRSALAVFADELDDHRQHGPCSACSRPPVLAVPDLRMQRAA